jgi:hypothetical protein
MTPIHYFQRYSQKENVITNNALLLLSRIYSSSPRNLAIFFQELLDPVKISVGPTILQQTKIKHGTVPDGSISQESFKIVVETKQGSNFREEQIRGHLKDFKDEKLKILLLLGNAEADLELINRVKADAEKESIMIRTATFQELLLAAQQAAEVDEELAAVVEDFQGFLNSMGLLSDAENWMRIVTCSKTIEYNVELGLYHEPEDRTQRKYRYLGLYANKAVRHVGKVTKTVDVSFKDGLVIPRVGSPVPTAEEEQRIQRAAKLAYEQQGWDHRAGSRYVFVEKFVPTEFKKSGSPLWGTRYFDLTSLLGISPLPDINAIAEGLKLKTW